MNGVFIYQTYCLKDSNFDLPSVRLAGLRLAVGSLYTPPSTLSFPSLKIKLTFYFDLCFSVIMNKSNDAVFFCTVETWLLFDYLPSYGVVPLLTPKVPQNQFQVRNFLSMMTLSQV